MLSSHAVIEKLATTEKHLYITATMTSVIATFSRDNMEQFQPWVSVQLARIARAPEKNRLCLIVREFTPLCDGATAMPIKRIAGCVITHTEVHTLTAGEMRRAHLTDAQTGKQLPPEPHVTFIDFDKMLAKL